MRPDVPLIARVKAIVPKKPRIAEAADVLNVWRFPLGLAGSKVPGVQLDKL